MCSAERAVWTSCPSRQTAAKTEHCGPARQIYGLLMSYPSPSVVARFVVLVLNAGWDSPDKDVINY